MKKIFVLFVISILLAVLDNTLMPFFAIKGIYPSLLLIFIICYSIINGKWEGLWLGVLAGILQDIYFLNGFGLHPLANMITCVVAGEIGTNIFKEKSLVPVASNLILSLFKGIFIFIILYLEGIYMNIATIAYNSIYNMIVSVFVYRIVYKLCQKEFMQKKWKFNRMGG